MTVTRGVLRIYLGAAPGVGKTVAMLGEGRRRLDRGTDVVVGYVDTHGRPHTADALEGLEVVPCRSIEHRGTAFEEMDTAAIIARRPQVALVDELAHTNVPGSTHDKRWQDVHDLLAAGIDVISTVNIQHLESLNDATLSITGVVQRETVPDAVVRAADQIELVDMSPEALRRRMAHGNVYAAQKVDAALANYFRLGNLSALRELALLWLADRVEENLDRYRSDHSITGTWPTRTRVVVALSGGPEGATLLRRAARLALAGNAGELHAVYVARADGLTDSSGAQIDRLRRLTADLGGTFHTVGGNDAAAAVLDYARAVNAQHVIIGLGRSPRWRSMLRPSTGERIIAGSGEDIDVHVVTHELARSTPPPRPGAALPGRRVAQGAVLAVVMPCLLTLGLQQLGRPSLPVIVQLYLLVTVLIALVGGLWPAIAAGVISSLLINWYFTSPLGTLTIADGENAFALLLFVAVGAVVSAVVHRSARRAAAVTASAHEVRALAELSHSMLSSTDQLALLVDRAAEMFGQTSVAVVCRVGDEHELVAATGEFPADPVAGASRTIERVDDDHHLVLVGPPVPADRQRLLSAYAAHAAAVLNRRRLQRLAESAEGLERDNRARTALLSAVSHDLRTPLAGIKAAVGSLRSTEVTFDPSDEAELLEAIEQSADRLDALIDNLLAMSRLQVGGLVADPRPVDLAEVIESEVRALPEPSRVEWTLGPDARRVVADPGLLDRVLGNVLENALRFQPAAGPVRVSTGRIGDRVLLRVVDQGPGVPAAAMETIFRPFQRYGDTPSGDGVGLGLAVARGFAEAMGATLAAEDTPGGGVTMVVSLQAHDGRPTYE